MPDRSPWWYRERAYVMGLLYAVTIFGSYRAARAFGLDAEPVVRHWGSANERTVFAVGLLLVLAGWLLRVWGTSYLRAEVVWSSDALADHLYIAGPFRFTRNPLYLGNLLLACAIALFAPPVGWPIVVLAQILFVVALIRVEERGLRERYGDAFDAYRKSVPSLFPRLLPANQSVAVHSSFAAAMKSETLMAGFVATFATFAILGRAVPYAWAFAVAGMLYQYVTRTRPL